MSLEIILVCIVALVMGFSIGRLTARPIQVFLGEEDCSDE